MFVALAGCGRAPQPGQPVTVDDVAAQPEKFTGALTVAGKVEKVDAARSMFALGCEDACLMLPVRFAGALPAGGSSVVVRGRIERGEDGRYVLAAQEVTQR